MRAHDKGQRGVGTEGIGLHQHACGRAEDGLTYDVGPAGLEPAKPGRDAARVGS